jgi:hypothetical protein
MLYRLDRYTATRVSLGRQRFGVFNVSGGVGVVGQADDGGSPPPPVPTPAPATPPENLLDPACCPVCGDRDRVGVFRRTVLGLVCRPCAVSGGN